MATIKASENEFPQVLFAEGAAPATPASGLVKAYAKSDGLLYSKDDAGTETPLGGSSVADILDLPTAETDDTLVLAPDGVGGVEFRAEAGGAALAAASYKRTSGDYTTTSASFVDVDGTNLALTISTGARRVLITVAMTFQHSTTSTTFFDIAIDGTREGGSNGIVAITEAVGGGNAHNASFSYITDALSAGSHTFKLQWKTSAATATIRGGSSSLYIMKMAVVELGNA